MADNSRQPGALIDNWTWQRDAACAGKDVNIFFHPEFERGASRARRVMQAQSICSACPVRQRCQDYAVETEEFYGTWGGVDELTRKDQLKATRRRRRDADEPELPRTA
jgi:WhiB family redox-sensing transcriptional regulator